MPSSPAPVDAMPCDAIAYDAFAFLDGALAPDAHATLATHLGCCLRCRGRVASSRRFLGAVRRSGRAVVAPRALRERVTALLADWRAGATAPASR